MTPLAAEQTLSSGLRLRTLELACRLDTTNAYADYLSLLLEPCGLFCDVDTDAAGTCHVARTLKDAGLVEHTGSSYKQRFAFEKIRQTLLV